MLRNKSRPSLQVSAFSGTLSREDSKPSPCTFDLSSASEWHNFGRSLAPLARNALATLAPSAGALAHYARLALPAEPCGSYRQALRARPSSPSAPSYDCTRQRVHIAPSLLYSRARALPNTAHHRGRALALHRVRTARMPRSYYLLFAIASRPPRARSRTTPRSHRPSATRLLSSGRNRFRACLRAAPSLYSSHLRQSCRT